jgi:hypothetical protein
MFDSLRDSGMEEEEPIQEVKGDPNSKTTQEPFLGMTAGQRFLIAVLVLMMVCVLGVFLLLLTQKIYLPFF